MGSDDATVLIVDDEQTVADVYALRLRDRYETRTAYGGRDALDAIDETVDVVLLDRRMPALSGDDVLTEIRDRDLNCRVVMLTAVDPDIDILELPFDDYLCKPVEKSDLVDVIDQQLVARQYGDRLSEYLHVTSKLALLEAGTDADHDEVKSLRERADELQAELDDTLESFEDIDAAFREIERMPD
jgi:DNA-binding response OmpR family regulator